MLYLSILYTYRFKNCTKQTLADHNFTIVLFCLMFVEIRKCLLASNGIAGRLISNNNSAMPRLAFITFTFLLSLKINPMKNMFEDGI